MTTNDIGSPATERRSPGTERSGIARVAAYALVGGPLALVAGNLLATGGGGDDARSVAILVHHGAREQASILAFLLGFTLLAAGTAGMVGAVRSRGAGLALAGGALALPGLTAIIALVAGGLYDIGAARTVPAADVVRITTAAGSTGGASVLFVLSALALPIGMTLVAAALWRAGIVRPWVPAVVFAAFAVLTLVESTVGGIAGDLLLLVGLGWIARGVTTR